MHERAGWFTAHDGLRLFERSWSPTGNPQAVVAILHGGGEHSGRYGQVAERLTGIGYRVDAFDQRSYGRSERVRDVALQCDDAADLVADTAAWLDPRGSNLPLLAIGHSMGGLVATALAVDGRLDVAGLILLGPALRITPVDAMAHAADVAVTEPDRIVVTMGRGGFDASSRDPVMKALSTRTQSTPTLLASPPNCWPLDTAADLVADRTDGVDATGLHLDAVVGVPERGRAGDRHHIGRRARACRQRHEGQPRDDTPFDGRMMPPAVEASATHSSRGRNLGKDAFLRRQPGRPAIRPPAEAEEGEANSHTRSGRRR